MGSCEVHMFTPVAAESCKVVYYIDQSVNSSRFLMAQDLVGSLNIQPLIWPYMGCLYKNVGVS